MDGGTATAALLLPGSEGSSTAPAIMDMGKDIRCIGDDAVGGSIAGLLELLLLLLLLLAARDGGSMAP